MDSRRHRRGIKLLIFLNLGCGGQDPEHQIKIDREISKDDEVIQYDIDKGATWKNLRGDAGKLPFKDKSIDGVYASHILEHTNNPFEVLQEIKRITSEGLVLSVPNATFYRFVKDNKDHLFSWTQETLKQLLTASGWRVANIYTRPLLRYNYGIAKRLVLNIMFKIFGKNEIVAFCLPD